MNIKKLIKELKKYENTNCDVRIQIYENNFFDKQQEADYYYEYAQQLKIVNNRLYSIVIPLH